MQAGGPAEQFGHEAARLDAAGQGVMMRPVPAGHDIVRAERRRASDRNGLLADRWMQPAGNLPAQ